MIAIDPEVTLVAPGAAFLTTSRTLVVADVHAGYVATLQKRGFALPDADDGELHVRMRGLLAQTRPETVVIAGDLVHGEVAAEVRGAESPLRAFLGLLGGCKVVAVLGNHDRAIDAALGDAGVTVTETWSVDGHTVVHGDEESAALATMREACAARGRRLVIGHFHPALGLSDGKGARRRVAAFAHGAGFLALPALSPLARGSDLRVEEYSAPLEALVEAARLQVAVVVGREVIATGSLGAIRKVSRG